MKFVCIKCANDRCNIALHDAGKKLKNKLEARAGVEPTYTDLQLTQRRNKNVAAVALANKNARIVWALLNHNRDYQDNHKMLVAA